MNLYEDGLSHLFGLRPRNKKVKAAVGLILLFAAVATSINFTHAIEGYSKRRATMVVNGMLMPGLKALQDNVDKQAKIAELQQQRVQSGH